MAGAGPLGPSLLKVLSELGVVLHELVAGEAPALTLSQLLFELLVVIALVLTHVAGLHLTGVEVRVRPAGVTYRSALPRLLRPLDRHRVPVDGLHVPRLSYVVARIHRITTGLRLLRLDRAHGTGRRLIARGDALTRRHLEPRLLRRLLRLRGPASTGASRTRLALLVELAHLLPSHVLGSHPALLEVPRLAAPGAHEGRAIGHALGRLVDDLVDASWGTRVDLLSSLLILLSVATSLRPGHALLRCLPHLVGLALRLHSRLRSELLAERLSRSSRSHLDSSRRGSGGLNNTLFNSPEPVFF